MIALDRASALTIILGSILFLAAAFSPISWIFAMPDPARRLSVIEGARLQWNISQLFLGLGAIITVVGIGMLAHRVSGRSGSGYLYGSVAVMTTGALPWIWHLYLRTMDPRMFTAGGIPHWLFVAYSLLTIVGLALLGGALLHLPVHPWAGWMVIGAAVLFLVVVLVMRDIPPLLFYLVTLAVGILLYRGSASGAGFG